MTDNDDIDLERPRDEHGEGGEEMTPAEARWVLKTALVLALIAAVVAVSGAGGVSNHLRVDILGGLGKARDSSTAAIRSAVGASVDTLGHVASQIGEVPKALGGDVAGVLQQASDSSSAALRSAVGDSHSTRLASGSHAPFHKQYHSSVTVCVRDGQDAYVSRSVSDSSVPSLVSRGAIYPVPAGGCS